MLRHTSSRSALLALPRLTLLAALLMLTLTAAAQTVTVTGTVTEAGSGETLIGAAVLQKGTTNGVVTDIDGRYSITVPTGAVLSFTYMGYEKKDVKVGGRRQINVELAVAAEELDELVVIGYGVQRKSDITGSISSVGSKEINHQPVANALQTLQGRAAGVNIIQNTGAPGSNTTIKIRGTGTVNDADPLYVVDGFIVDNIDYINPGDIDNVEIFKDAASSAVYGSRAANGVVAITTKSGHEGKTRITYDGYVGFSNPWRKIDVMDVEQYALMTDYINDTKRYSENGVLYATSDGNGGYFDDPHKHVIVDTIRNNSAGNYWDAITQTGLKTQHGVSVSGGTGKTQFMTSLSYYDESGIVKTSSYDRVNARANVQTELAKWLRMNANMAYTHERREGVPEGSSSILKQALYESPMNYLYDNKGFWYSNNPLAVLDRYNAQMKRSRMEMNISLDAKLMKLLSYQFKASYYNTHQIDDDFSEVWGLNEDFSMPGSLAQVYKYQNDINKWEINNLLTFAWKNSDHDVTLLAGQTAEGFTSSFQQSYRKGTPSNEDAFHYLSSAYTGDKTYGLDREWTAIGLIGRLNYNFRDTWLLQANVRADGSSKFSKKNRWGIFPSVSLGWKFTGMEFMESVDWLTLGKLRVGWGILGNNRIDELARYTYLTTGYNYSYGLGNHSIWEGSTATVLGNDDIRWERCESYNAGIDLAFLDSRLLFTAEYFDRQTTDMLLRVPTVSSAGLDASPMTNAGAVRNWGLESDIKWRDNIGRDFRYEVGFNLSWINNVVTSLGTGNEPIYGSYLGESSIVDYVTKTAVGLPIGCFFGYVTDGLFQSYEEVEASPQYEPGKNYFEQTTRPGDFRFKDLNDDGAITEEDRTYLGSPLPKFIFGVPLSVGYRHFDLTAFFYGQTGNKVFNVTDYYLYNAASGNNIANIRDLHWSGQLTDGRAFFPANLDAKVPDLDPDDAARNFRASDFFVHDGSYLRLKELRLTYTIPQSLVKRLKIQDLALSLSGYNLLTWTAYNGLDPEVGKVVGTEGNNLSMGVDQGNYPQARSFTFGIKLGI